MIVRVTEICIFMYVRYLRANNRGRFKASNRTEFHVELNRPSASTVHILNAIECHFTQIVLQVQTGTVRQEEQTHARIGVAARNVTV